MVGTKTVHSPIGKRPRVVIIGAGVVGLGIAWRLAGRAEVLLFDRGKAGAGASHAAAGMLAACAEAEPGEEDLVALGRDSQARWPAFAEELLTRERHRRRIAPRGHAGSGADRGRSGDAGASFGISAKARPAAGVALRRRKRAPRNRIWPASSPARVFSPQDHQVDNRKLSAALRIAVEAAGAKIHEHQAVKEIAVQGGRTTGVVLEDGTHVAADRVVLAAGAWSRTIAGLPPDRRPPVRPIKGQMFALRMDANAPLLNHVLWAPGAYLVPRRDGRLIVGATVEEKGFDDTITAGGMLTLLEAAWRAIPAVEELPIDEIWVGHRPGSRDDAPILGRAPLENLFYATGHHRNGILLAPVTADAMARLILDDVVEPAIKPFGLERFLPARAAE